MVENLKRKVLISLAMILAAVFIGSFLVLVRPLQRTAPQEECPKVFMHVTISFLNKIPQ